MSEDGMEDKAVWEIKAEVSSRVSEAAATVDE